MSINLHTIIQTKERFLVSLFGNWFVAVFFFLTENKIILNNSYYPPVAQARSATVPVKSLYFLKSG